MSKENEIVPAAQPQQLASQEVVDQMKTQSLSFFNPAIWQGMQMIAQTFLQSGAMPKTMDTAPKLMVALEAGKEAGLQPLEAINSFYFVNGKVSLYGEMAIAQVIKAGHKVEWGRCDDVTATVKITRGDNKASNETTFTIKEANEKGLTAGKDVWKKWPGNMLRFKAFHACARFVCPDALHGIPVKEVVEGEYEIEEPKPAKAEVVMTPHPQKTDVIKTNQTESLEEAINKEPEKVEVMPEAPAKESAAAKKMRLAREKRDLEAKSWPEEVCVFLRFIKEVAGTDAKAIKDTFSEEIVQLCKDAAAGEWKGYEAYPSLKDEIAKIPADFK